MLTDNYPIPSGAPAAYHLGTDDISPVQLPRIPLAIPQHCVQVFLNTQTGPETEELVVGTKLINMYGQESFNPRGQFYNHQTLLAVGLNSRGNLMSVKRIVADDAQESYITLYLDIIADNITQYERNVTTEKFVMNGLNKIPLTSGGNPVTVPGFKVKWVANTTKQQTPKQGGGMDETILYTDGVDIAGNQTVGFVTSRRYPIATFKHNFKSKAGDLVGISMWSQTTDNSSRMPTKMMEKYKAYPYFMKLLTKSEETATATIKSTLTGSKQVTVTLKEDVYDPLSDIAMFAGEAFVDRYQSISDPRYPKQYGDIGLVKIYTENIATVSQMLLEAEVAAGVLDSCDFTSDLVADDQKFLYNIVNFTTSSGAPYKSVEVVAENDSATLASSSTIFLGGGSNGTLTSAQYNTKVRAYMQRYSDENDPLQSYAGHPQNNIYDTGFELATKMELARFISIRKNTLVHLGTYVQGEDFVDTDTETSTARTLQSYLANYPESDYFGTEVFRGTVTPGSYKLSNSRYRDRVSLVYERAMKRSDYMGSSEGKWKNGFNYDGYPGSLISSGYDIKPEFVSKTGVLTAWDAGTVYVAQYDTSSWHFPCFRTVYNNDTSILNSDQVASAIAHVNTIVSQTHRKFQGIEGKTPAELSKMYNDDITAQLKGKFDNKYKITPQAGFTSMDQLRGYSITVPVLFEGTVMPTVMTTYVTATRMSTS